MIEDLVYFYLLSPLHTGGTTQEGNLLGIARESHTDLPYIPSSSIRGRLRAATPDGSRTVLWGNTIDDVTSGVDDNLKQGALWIGDGSILWLPVPSLSHGVIWVSSPLLLRRWAKFNKVKTEIPADYSTNLNGQKPVYLKDAILKPSELNGWNTWQNFVPQAEQSKGIKRVLVLPDKHCATLLQMALWRQVKVKLDEHKTVDGGFRYEEAIPPDTLMYFPWGITAQANGKKPDSTNAFHTLIEQHSILQIGGQESLGRGFVQTWLDNN
ncbi:MULTISPECIES: type III-B CRISPR module RAMP protein Cmr4 [Cyanophyceae]|uniref:type III-B CRISPR module RAMP protein Cmr4 n=1 Tax=Cyanophyceae TaxID=3028117 RepID=UPI00168761AA|nr:MULTISPECIES: type III-B CRISPR module RAMP protein Cmr4 [Cyanophyceae]MBD1914276.1 type III-B CRISPR module RAMP protein Cmr4 [Phormidium sp. FACHB-77]MBD2031211.1 type III-B CRISPR module RAMP protein Cmr4 [Phormidium sp. FACHB-322]MBD2049610.1 type III-B CRISPR module RAMP protein Cmr4 [Leptolyngbya sp. FACHB-60]